MTPSSPPDTETFAPEPLSLTLDGGETVQVWPLTIDRVLRLSRALQAVDLSAGMNVLQFASLPSAQQQALRQVIEIALACSAEWVSALSPAQAVVLLAAVVQHNPEYFKPRTQPAPTGKATRWDWSDTFQVLIRSGHTMAAIRAYTLAQCQAFMRAIQLQRRAELVDLACVGRAAQADKSGFQKYLRSLEAG